MNDTRQRLLTAARDEFAAHGIAGARVDAIAARAGVNKERIYGYFGSKEKLFDAVVTDAKAEHATGIGLPSGDLAEYVGKLYDYHRDHPVLLRLLLWESLHYGDRPVPDPDGRAQAYDEKVSALADALDDPSGATADPHATAATLLTLLGLACWPHAMPQLAGFLVRGVDETERHAVLRAHTVEFARRALERRP
ncbi:TetR family transcriptional regulator [Prauserella alba]|uniref:HTH tetR-type domain-containing protein n=1 Tax=Prauserella alba TaxID=176898 RepID=A0ABN1VDM6_9PSEU|nr:TetR family transcriptional regulator [Prauserella alba]MCP2182434.1 transcriptional regulator, TetR family [Prauserella alba]